MEETEVWGRKSSRLRNTLRVGAINDLMTCFVRMSWFGETDSAGDVLDRSGRLEKEIEMTCTEKPSGSVRSARK